MRRAALWLALVMAGLAPSASAEGVVDLRVRLEGVQPLGGALRVGLFDSAEGFARRRQGLVASRVVTADRPVVAVRFDGLTPGRYAVTAFHDLNDNRKLDRLLGLVPLEGVALSRNPGLLPPPGFDDIAVEVPVSGEIVVRLRYPRG